MNGHQTATTSIARWAELLAQWADLEMRREDSVTTVMMFSCIAIKDHRRKNLYPCLALGDV